jgi:GNAT superfamily N-acetyltransferase
MAAGGDGSVRARAWRDRMHAAICDVIEPWEHGTIVRSTRHPSYYDFNLVRVEDAEAIAATELVAVADRALAGLGHRRVSFDFLANAEPLRAQFEAAGWTAMRLLVLHHDGSLPPQPPGEVAEVPYDAVAHLRVAWHHESFPGSDPTSFHRQAREVAMGRGVVVLAVVVEGSAVGYAQLERDGDGTEVSQVYVHQQCRGRGLGTALTAAAIRAAAGARDLWISADDDDRPKHLYARLGFRPVWTAMEFLRVP